MAVEKKSKSLEKEIKDMNLKEIENLINNKDITKENQNSVEKRLKEIYIKNKKDHKNTSVVLDLLHKLYSIQLEIIEKERFENSPAGRMLKEKKE